VARAILTGDYSGFPEQPNAKAVEKMEYNLQGEDGVGEPIITKFLHDIPGINSNTVKQALANLKTSGIYDRIIGEVQADLATQAQAEAEAAMMAQAERREAEAAKTKAEAERKAAEEERARAREEERKAKEKRAAEIAAEKEAKRKAELEAKAKRAAERAAYEEQQRKEAEEREKLRAAEAEVRRLKAEAEAKRKTEEAEKAYAKKQAADRAKAAAAEEDRKLRESNLDFDYEGVAQHLKVASHVDRFRELMHAEGIRPYVTRADHEPLAKAVAELAAEEGIHSTRFVGFMDQRILELAIERRRQEHRLSKEQETEAEKQDAHRQAMKKLDMFSSGTRTARSSFFALLPLAKTADLTVDDLGLTFRTAIEAIREIVDEARKHGLFAGWTSPPEWTAPSRKPAHTNGRSDKLLAHLNNDNAGERHNAADILHKQAKAAGKTVAQMLGLD